MTLRLYVCSVLRDRHEWFSLVSVSQAVVMEYSAGKPTDRETRGDQPVSMIGTSPHSASGPPTSSSSSTGGAADAERSSVGTSKPGRRRNSKKGNPYEWTLQRFVAMQATGCMREAVEAASQRGYGDAFERRLQFLLSQNM